MSASTLNEALELAARSAAGLRLLDRRERAEWLGWGDLNERAKRAAGRLAAAGVAPGERVALVYPTGAAFFEAFFGTLVAAAVPVPLYPPVRLGRLDEYHRRTAAMLRAVGARLVLTDGRVRRLLGESVARARPALGCHTLDTLPAAGAVRPAAPRPDDLALVQFSSGTTVSPKPVALTHRAILAQVLALNSFWPDEPAAGPAGNKGTPGVRHTGVSWLPLYHDMGLIGCVLPALERPSDLTLLPPEAFVARPALWLRALSRYRATVSPAPNFAYGLCVEKVRDEEMEGVDLSTWRVALNGAEPVAPGVLRAFADRFARWGFRREALTPVYGLSEAALAVTFSDTGRPFTARRFARRLLAEEGRAVVVDGPGWTGIDEAEAPQRAAAAPPLCERAHTDPAAGERLKGVELVSVGRPIPGFEISIRDEAGKPLPEGRVGRVWTRGPSLMRGYLDRPQATARALRDGWLDTGDLGFLLGGELHLTGRAKDLIIVRGRNHAPEEVEHAVGRLPAVRSGCAAAVAHLPEGAEREEVLLFVERARRAQLVGADEIAQTCRQAVLSEAGIPLDRVEVLEPGTLPRTSSGKIRRREALRRHLSGELTPPGRLTPLALARAMTRSWRSFARLKGEA